MENRHEIRQPWWKHLGWLVLIWVASVASLGLAAAAMRLLMHMAGLTS